MKPATATILFAVACIALVAVPSSAYPYFYPPHLPIFPPHPFLGFYPPGGHFVPSFPFPSAPGPSSGVAPHFPSFPPPVDMSKCTQALHDSTSSACSPISYDAGGCCTHLTGLGEACSAIPYYQSPAFQGVVARVCASGSSPSPPGA